MELGGGGARLALRALWELVAARSAALSEPLRMSADVIELSCKSLPESVLFLTFDAVIALKAIFEEVTAW